VNKAFRKILDLRGLESRANDDHYLCRVLPQIKIAIVVVYVVIQAFLGKYALGQVIMLGIIPLILLYCTSIKIKDFLYRLIIPALLATSMGILNPLFDQTVVLTYASVEVTGGYVSLLVIFLKSIFNISMVLLLVSTTKINDISKGLSFFKLPNELIFLLLLMYRYITILLNEVSITIDAYSLRSTSNGIHFSVWATLVGQMMMRAYNRSNEVYQAMLLRGLDISE